MIVLLQYQTKAVVPDDAPAMEGLAVVREASRDALLLSLRLQDQVRFFFTVASGLSPQTSTDSLFIGQVFEPTEGGR